MSSAPPSSTPANISQYEGPNRLAYRMGAPIMTLLLVAT
jgi:hypothetical protein